MGVTAHWWGEAPERPNTLTRGQGDPPLLRTNRPKCAPSRYPDMPPVTTRSHPGHITDPRLGTSIGLLPLNGAESLWTLLLFSVFRKPRPTKMGQPRHALLAPRF